MGRFPGNVLTPDCLAPPKAAELLAAEEANRFKIINLGDLLQISAEKTIKQGNGTDDVRPFRQT